MLGLVKPPKRVLKSLNTIMRIVRLYRCECLPGFTAVGGDSEDCTDVDECIAGDSLCTQVCDNNRGSYRFVNFPDYRYC